MSFLMNTYRYGGYSSTKSILFDGVNDFVTAGNVLDFDYNDEFSISCFVNISSLANMALVSKQTQGGTFRGYSLWVQPDGNVYFQMISSVSPSYVLATETTTFVASISTWYHICVTKSTSSDVSAVKIYVNAVDESTTASSNTLGSNTTLNSIDFQVSGRNGSNSVFGGYMDEVRVWSKELTSTEVLADYNSGCPTTPNTTSLELWYKNGEGDTYPTILDNSTNSNDGTMTNMTSGDITTTVPC